MRKSILIFFLLVSVLACSANSIQRFTVNNKDTLNPFNKEINNNIFFTLRTKAQAYLSLESLENGFENLQLRIWRNAGALLELTIISHKDSLRRATFTSVSINWDIQQSDYSFAFLGSKVLSPSSGWDHFIENLSSSELIVTPDESKLPKHGAIMDGEVYFIEVATKTYYRFYTISNPYFKENLSPERQSFTKALNYIEKELKNY